MDYPRQPHVRTSQKRAGVALAVVAALLLGYDWMKAGAIEALDHGANAGFGLALGAPAIPPASLEAAGGGAGVSGAAWLEAASTPNGAEATPSHSGGLFSPQYTEAGHLRVPADYPSWVFVGGATGLAYGEDTLPVTRHDEAPGMFTHVFLEPGAFAHYLETGEFREGTTFALDMREPTSGVSIATDGWFAGKLRGTHLAVKDTERFGGWAYFNLAADGLGRRVRSSSCNDCHVEHGDVDNVFTQFYPLLSER